MQIRSSTQRYCGFDCFGLSIITIWYWISKTLYNCFVPGRQERSQVPRISGHAEMVCNFTLTAIQFDSSWKLGWLGEENIAHTGWFPNCASPFSVPKWKRGGAFKNLRGDQLKTSLCTRICGGKMYFVFFCDQNETVRWLILHFLRTTTGWLPLAHKMELSRLSRGIFLKIFAKRNHFPQNHPQNLCKSLPPSKSSLL